MHRHKLEFDYVLKKGRSNQRNVILRIRHGIVEISVPSSVRQKDIDAILHRQRRWIVDELKKSREIAPSAAHTLPNAVLVHGQALEILYASTPHDHEPSTLQIIENRLVIASKEPELLKNHPTTVHHLLSSFLRRMAIEQLPERLWKIAEQLQVFPKQVQIRGQSSRFGSCSSRQTITLNWRLLQAPWSIVDYVIVHELAHLRFMNHSSVFWKQVESWMPEYHQHKDWLRTHSQQLFQLEESVRHASK